MSEPAPAAPAAEPTAPATPAPAPEAPAQAPESTPTQPAATAPTEGATNTYFSNEQLSEMQKFIENNGGYETAWKKMKEGISRPQPKSEPQPAQQQPQPQQQPQAPQNASQAPREGIYTMQELAMASYFRDLSQNPKYANISEEIANGNVLQEAKKLNINIVDQNGLNDKLLRDFLDMYSASRPATQTSATPSASQPDYVKVDKVTTMEQANQIELQNIQLKAQGKPEHPLTAEAKAFVKDYYSKKK